MFHKVITAAEAQKKAEVQHKKRRLKMIEEEKQDVYKRIMENVNRGHNYCRYSSISAPDGELYSEVKDWLISLGYTVEDCDNPQWKISW